MKMPSGKHLRMLTSLVSTEVSSRDLRNDRICNSLARMCNEKTTTEKISKMSLKYPMATDALRVDRLTLRFVYLGGIVD
jgi:hypothetical protein